MSHYGERERRIRFLDVHNMKGTIGSGQLNPNFMVALNSRPEESTLPRTDACLGKDRALAKPCYNRLVNVWEGSSRSFIKDLGDMEEGMVVPRKIGAKHYPLGCVELAHGDENK